MSRAWHGEQDRIRKATTRDVIEEIAWTVGGMILALAMIFGAMAYGAS